MALEPPQRQPVFVLGLTPRSGTHYLYDLFSLHPDVWLPHERWEDALLWQAHRLVGYVDAVSGRWIEGSARPGDRDLLLRRIGDGIVSFLTDSAGGKLVVTKMPRVRNLPHFFELFPDARALLLVRDGRATAESLRRGFGFAYATATRDWARAAQTVLDFRDAEQGRASQFRILRYEDLLGDVEAAFGEVLRFCGLDAAAYDFESARSLPLRGSSVFRGERSDLHWKPVPRPEDFAPEARFAHWSSRLHDEFELVAGEQARALGYDVPPRRAGIVARGKVAADDAVYALAQRWPFSTASWLRRRLNVRRSGGVTPAEPGPREAPRT